MAAAVRVIGKLDIKGPNLIKGLELDGQRVLGKAWDFAKTYNLEGIDELFFQDTVASLYRRNSLKDIIRQTAQEVFIPFTVAGGIRSLNDIKEILHAGADKVAINTAAIENPGLIKEASRVFGSQCIVSSLEVFKKSNGKYEVWSDYGREPSGIEALEWAQRMEELGAGEIFLTSINRDGRGEGYDLELVNKIATKVSIPVVACGGAGEEKHVLDVIKDGKADAVAVASMFHYHYLKDLNDEKEYRKTLMSLRMGEHMDSGNMDFIFEGYGHVKDLFVRPTTISQVKKYLKSHGVEVRL